MSKIVSNEDGRIVIEQDDGKFVEIWDELTYIPLYNNITDVTPRPIIVKDVEMFQILVPPKPNMQIDLTFWDKARIIGDNASAVWKFFKFIYPVLGSIIVIINWLTKLKKERT